MPQRTALVPRANWVELRSTDADWENADPALLGSLLAHIQLIRAFEECVLELASQGLVHGPAHSSIGQEGGAAGSIVGLKPGDQINGSHRGHHQFLSKALQHVASGGIDPRVGLGPHIKALLKRTLAEILGLSQGFCKGRGGSMHLQWTDAGCLGTNAIVGGGIPLAAGAAWAHKHSGTDAIAISYFGDGAMNIGSALETMNLAAAWRLPLCFFVENNGYAVSTSINEVTAEPRLSSRGQAFAIPSWKVDGMDPLAVHLAMNEATAHMRAGEGPTIVEADVYRFYHQNGPFAGSAFGYRSKEEEASWRERDPLMLIGRRMLERGLIDDDGIAQFAVTAKSAMQEALEALTEPHPGGAAAKRRIRPGLWPDPQTLNKDIRSEKAVGPQVRLEEEPSFSGALVSRKFVDVIADVIARRMETDSSVVVLGEDVHRLKGGTNGATRGLSDRFPDRVLGTPISENAFVGLAGGMAMDGRFKPIVEFMYPDFMWIAADQLFNQIGKARHMFGGAFEMPLVLRTKVAMGTGYGSQHSMDPAGIFATACGWRIAVPSTPFDYVGIMNAALALRDPVLVIEHVDLYGTVASAPSEDLDYHLEVGKAAVRRTGSALTILTYLSMVGHTLEAVEKTGIDAEVIDLRWLDRASLDWPAIEKSVQKTGNVLVVEQGSRGTSYGGWLADEIQRRLFDWLDQPVQRVTGSESSPSVSKVLERAACARTEEVVAGMRLVVQNSGGR